MIRLSDAKPISNGSYRRAFVHPDDDSKVIKVSVENPKSYLEKKGPYRYLRNLLSWENFFADANKLEFKQFKALKRRGVFPSKHLVEVFGYVDTDLGRGLIVERVKNFRYPDYPSVQNYVNHYGPYQDKDDREAIKEYFEFLLNTPLYGKVIYLHNMSMIKGDDGKPLVRAHDFKLLETKEFIPISNWIGYFRDRKAVRRIRRAQKNLWPIVMGEEL